MEKFRLIMEKEKGFSVPSAALTSPRDVSFFAQSLGLHKESQEVLWVISTDAKGRPIGFFEVHRGALTRSVVSIKEIMKRVLLSNAAGFVVVHNHPSGDTEPSPKDREATKELVKAAHIMETDFFDHIIIGDEHAGVLNFYSLHQQEATLWELPVNY